MMFCFLFSCSFVSSLELLTYLERRIYTLFRHLTLWISALLLFSSTLSNQPRNLFNCFIFGKIKNRLNLLFGNNYPWQGHNVHWKPSYSYIINKFWSIKQVSQFFYTWLVHTPGRILPQHFSQKCLCQKLDIVRWIEGIGKCGNQSLSQGWNWSLSGSRCPPDVLSGCGGG